MIGHVVANLLVQLCQPAHPPNLLDEFAVRRKMVRLHQVQQRTQHPRAPMEAASQDAIHEVGVGTIAVSTIGFLKGRHAPPSITPTAARANAGRHDCENSPERITATRSFRLTFTCPSESGGATHTADDTARPAFRESDTDFACDAFPS